MRIEIKKEEEEEEEEKKRKTKKHHIIFFFFFISFPVSPSFPLQISHLLPLHLPFPPHICWREDGIVV